MTDTHCHLNLDIYRDDLGEVLDRAWQAGLDRILIPGIDLATSRAAVALSERHPKLFAAVGIHPHDASTWDDNTLPALMELARHPKTIAIGEIGLDYYRDRSPRPLQQQVFRAQLDLAADMGLPVIIHSRDALADVWAALQAWQAALTEQHSRLAERPGVYHSYDGDLPYAQQAAEAGFFIGISGPVTFKNAALKHEVAAGLPQNRLLIETDAPYLTPHPYRGRRNEPAYVALVAEQLAVLHDQPVDSILQVTWDNADQLFRWGANR